MSFWKTIAAKISTNTAVDLLADSATHTLNTLEYEHHKIHAGDYYSLHATNDALVSGSYIDLVLTTPNTAEWSHMLPQAYSNGAIHLYIYENPTVTNTAGLAGGGTSATLLVPMNHNRNSANTATLNVRAGASATNVGATLIAEWHIGATGQVSQVGGIIRTIGEFILKQNEDYLFRVESHDTTVSISQVLSWYEHTSTD